MIKDFYRRLREESPVPRLAFYLGLTIELLMVIVDKSNYVNPIEGYLFRLTFLLFACKILLTRYEWREWVLILVMETVGLISYRVTGANDIIRIVTFVAACKGIPLREALKYTFYVTLAGCLVIVALAVTGIYGDISLTQAFGHESAETTRYIGVEAAEETRYTLGMGHPNALSCMFFMLAALGVYVWFDRMKWYSYLFLMLLNAGVYLLARSKTSMLITAAYLCGACLFTFVKSLRKKTIIYVCGLLVFLLCIAFSVDAAVCAQRVREAQWNEFFFCNPHDKPHKPYDKYIENGKIPHHQTGDIRTSLQHKKAGHYGQFHKDIKFSNRYKFDENTPFNKLPVPVKQETVDRAEQQKPDANHKMKLRLHDSGKLLVSYQDGNNVC